MRKYLLLFLGLISTCLSSQINAQYNQVKNTNVTFKIKNAGIQVEGKFTSSNSQIYLDEINPSQSSFVGSVQISSLQTGIQLRDKHVQEKEEFFNITKYPILSMKSVSVKLLNPGLYNVTWDLTMKGITRRFTSKVQTMPTTKNGVLIKTEFKLNRNDWNIGGSSLIMSDYVTIKIESTISK